MYTATRDSAILTRTSVCNILVELVLCRQKGQVHQISEVHPTLFGLLLGT